MRVTPHVPVSDAGCGVRAAARHVMQRHFPQGSVVHNYREDQGLSGVDLWGIDKENLRPLWENPWSEGEWAPDPALADAYATVSRH
jgi:hypothetical protein